MSMIRLCAFVLALLAFMLPVYLYGEFIWMAGFWDGFISELQRAEIPLFTAFNWLSLLMSVWFVILAIVAGRKNVKMIFVCSGLLYLAMLGATIGVDQHYRAHLFDDKGG